MGGLGAHVIHAVILAERADNSRFQQESGSCLLSPVGAQVSDSGHAEIEIQPGGEVVDLPVHVRAQR